MAAKILTVIFSYNRAMQLDALLRSLNQCIEDPELLDTKVLYRADSHQHILSYQQLREECKTNLNIAVDFTKEIFFKDDFLSLISTNRNLSCFPPIMIKPLFNLLTQTKYTKILFLVDDTIFIRDFSIAKLSNALDHHPRALGVSLRLGRNITYSYPKDSWITPPDFYEIGDGLLKFQWPDADLGFNYPLEVSSSLYRLEDLFYYLSRWNYKNPNYLESNMASKAKRKFSRFPELICPPASIAFSIPINKVQQDVPNRSGNSQKFSLDELLSRFLEGFRIDVTHLIDYTPNSTHEEVGITFTQEKGG